MEAKVCGSGMRKVSYILRISKHAIRGYWATNVGQSHPSQSVHGLLPDDHRLSKYFQMSLMACRRQQVYLRQNKVKDHLLGKRGYKLQLSLPNQTEGEAMGLRTEGGRWGCPSWETVLT